MEENKKKQFSYPQKFRQAWKKDPKLKDWLRENEIKANKSYCIYCKCDLISKYCDLLNHATTKKHLRAAVEFSSQQLTDSLPMITYMSNDTEAKSETNQIEIESVAHMKAERAKPVKRPRKSKIVNCDQEISMEYDETIQKIDCMDDEDGEEFTEILNLADNEFETITTNSILQEKKIKAEIEYFQQKTEYFAKLTENTKIHKTLMMLQARKLNLEIKKMQND